MTNIDVPEGKRLIKIESDWITKLFASVQKWQDDNAINPMLVPGLLEMIADDMREQLKEEGVEAAEFMYDTPSETN